MSNCKAFLQQSSLLVSEDGRTHRSKVLLSIFNSTKDKRVPQWVKLVTSIIHNTSQVVVHLFRSKGVAIIPHVVIQTANIKVKENSHEPGKHTQVKCIKHGRNKKRLQMDACPVNISLTLLHLYFGFTIVASRVKTQSHLGSCYLLAASFRTYLDK